MEEININEILKIFWKKKVDIMIILLIFFIAGCIYTLKFVTPKYNSTITMVLVASNNNENSNKTITTNDITLNSKLISTYNKLIKSKNVLKETISNLKLEMKEDELKDCISVKSIENSGLIEIKIETKNSELSAKIANEIANVFKEKVKEMYNINNIEIMSEASIEKEPTNINHKRDALEALLIGIIISTIYVIFVNMLDTTIKGANTIEEEFDLPVLASIPIWRSSK